jgi:tetratricopeptide (TPR) repeat protein
MFSTAPLLRCLAALLLWCAAALPASAADPGAQWREAVTLYKAGEYVKASEAFLKIAEDEKQISAALCHNLANSEFKRGEEAAASIWYRRALALNPWHAEAGQNYRFMVRTRAFSEFKPQGLAAYAAWMPRRWWVTACQISAWLSVIAVLWLVWATPRRGRRWPLVTLLSVALTGLVATGLGLLGKAMDPAPFAKRLISLPADAFARTAPAEAAGTVIALPPGSELMPIREEGYWTYCDLPGGSEGYPLRGWVRTKTTQPLWPWNPDMVE